MSDCVTFHYNPSRLGQGVGAPRNWKWSKKLDISLKSPTRGAPLVFVHRRPSPRPHTFTALTYVYIASSDNTVRAYDENDLIAGTDTPVWSISLGSPVTIPGSNIGDVVGIAGTPVLDPENNRMFVCACRHVRHDDVRRPPILVEYFMYSIDLFKGTVLQSAQLVDVGSAERDFRFNAPMQDQRGALNLVAGTVYATFAAYFGDDRGDYHGWLVACEADDLNTQHFLPTTRNVLGGGCWGSGGAAAAPDGSVYLATGNAMWPVSPENLTAARNAYFDSRGGRPPAEIGDYFLSILRVRKVRRPGNPPLPGVGSVSLDVADWFQPAQLDRPPDQIQFPLTSPDPVTLKDLDSDDRDFGSSSCMALPEIDGLHLVVVSTKAFVFLLNGDSLGRDGSALFTEHSFTGYDASPPNPEFSPAESHSAPAYLCVNGEHLVFLSGGGVGGLVCFMVDLTGPMPKLTQKWRADIQLTTSCASPTVAVFSGEEVGRPEFYPLVWIADTSANTIVGRTAILQAYQAVTGQLVFDSRTNPSDHLLGDLPHYAPITCAGSTLYLGTNDGFSVFRAIDPREIIHGPSHVVGP